MNDIQAKLAKLLAMTKANGASDDEAETAMRLAAGLAAKHGIDLRSIAAPSDKRKAKLKWSVGLKPHQELAASAAAILCGVQCNVYTGGSIGFVGRDENIEMAETLMFWLFEQIEGLYKEALPRGLSVKARADYRRSFKQACALRVRERAKAIIDEMKSDDAKARLATGSNALVVLGHFETLKSEVDEYWQGIRDAMTPAQRAKVDAHKPRSRHISMGSGSRMGYAAGDRVQLNKKL